MIKKGEARDDRYIRPKRAEKKFKLAKGLRQSVYLYGITGSGKTAFISDMLGKKTYYYFSAGKTGAEQIQIPNDDKNYVVVIDDMHEIMGDSQREEYADCLRLLMRQKNVWLILVARCTMPQWLMPLHVEHAFLIIKETDLQFDRMEQDAFFEKWKVSLSAEQAGEIWQIGGGSPLFLRLMALAGGDIKQGMNDMWKYLLHIYSQWDIELQEFMMEMSVVKSFDVKMAQIVTGRKNASQLIKRAMEMGNFLKEEEGRYCFNFFLRDSFQAVIENMIDVEQVGRIYYNAGHMYETYGDIPHALEMHEAGGDRKSILRLLIENARQNPAEGCYFELRRYYLQLPEEDIRTSPVLMAGMSMLQSMLMNREESEKWYRLLERFAAENEGSARREAKNRLLYLDIALPHRGSIEMVNLLKHAGILIKEGKTMLPEFSVTSNLPSLMSGGKDFCEWSKKDKELAATMGKIVELVLGKHGKGLVNIALAESYFEKGMDNYEVLSLAEKGRMQAEVGGKMDSVFVSVGILIWLSVLNGHAEDAQEMLESFEHTVKKQAPKLLANLHALRCRVSLYQGNVSAVLKWMEEAPDENKDFCSLERFRYMTKIRVYIQFGKYGRAYGLLQKMLYYAKEQKRNYIAIESMFLLALVKYHIKEEGWDSLLQECITRAEGYCFVRIFSREGGAGLKLLRAGKFVWINEEYHQQVLQECEKMRRFYPSYLKEKSNPDISLSENALNILRLQAEGYRIDEIADQLGITKNTVKYHSKETYRKLEVSSKAAAVNEAKNRGLI